MKIDLNRIRHDLDIPAKTVIEAMGLTPSFYYHCEKKQEIPCRYVYKAWDKIPGFYIPEDFFYYTSYTLLCNMKYYSMKQSEIAKLFNFASQGRVSYLMQENVPMYEMKEEFIKAFNPLIVPFKVDEKGNKTPITDLVPKMNFVTRRKRSAGPPGQANIKEVSESSLNGGGETEWSENE